jgi:hypothetical protein
MEPVFMILGQSAATAASLAVDSKKTVHEIDYSTLWRSSQRWTILEIEQKIKQLMPITNHLRKCSQQFELLFFTKPGP